MPASLIQRSLRFGTRHCASKQFYGSDSRGWFASRFSEGSDVSVRNVELIVSCGQSAFELGSSEIDSDCSSLTLSECKIGNDDGMIGSFVRLGQDYSPSKWIDIACSSLSLSSQTISSGNSICFSLPSESRSEWKEIGIRSVISQSQFHNTSSLGTNTASTRMGTLSEGMVGCEVECVWNALYGTISSRLGEQSDFLLQNTTLLECVNEDPSTTKTITTIPEFTSSADQIQIDPAFTDYIFQGCTIKATNMTQSFALINFNPLQGNVKFSGCTFTVECNTQHNQLVSITAVRDNKVDFVFDSCTVNFWRETETETTNKQIGLANFFNIYIVSSTFSPPTLSQYSSARSIYITAPISFLFLANNQFLNQNSAYDGGAIYAPYSIPRFFGTLFEGNKAKQGGAFFTASQYHQFASCIFRKNEAKEMGGAIKSHYLRTLWMFDCHFDQNVAKQTYTTNPTVLTHYRGNDIFAWTSTSSGISSSTVIGCTSTSESPKYGYYYTDAQNGNHPSEDILLPAPQASTHSAILFVEEGKSGTCLEGSACGSISTAMSKTGTGTSLIHVGRGEFAMSEAAITKAVEFRGLGFLVNSSTFTTITTTGIESEGSGNVSLVSLALKPSDTTATLFTVKSSRSFLGQVRVESIEEHTAPLLVFSAGTSNVINCWFNLISLNEHAAVSISDSASVTIRATWFVEISLLTGNGGSCIDFSSSGTLTLHQTDFAKCSSSGRAGCLDLTASTTTSSVVFDIVIFSFNKANATLTHFGNDVTYTNFNPSKISTLVSSGRTLSEMPHCLANASITTNIACPLRYFSGSGIDHPLAARFEQGVPLSWFKGFQIEIDALTESQTFVVLRVASSQILEPIQIIRKNIGFQLCALSPKVYGDTLVFVGEAGTFYARETPLTISQTFTAVPFVLAANAKQLHLQKFTIKITESIQNFPLVQCSGGTLTVESITFSIPSGLAITGHSMIECSSTDVQFLESSIANVTSTVDGAVLHLSQSTFTCRSSSLSNCKAPNGGVAWIELAGTNSILVKHERASTFASSFKNCVAIGDSADPANPTGKGGALFVTGTSSHATPIRFNDSSTNHARFEDNLAGTGNDLFITSSLFESVPTSSLKSFGGGSFSLDDHVAIEGRLPAESAEIGLLVPTPIVSVNGSVNELMTGMSGEDSMSCKWTSTFCATLGYGIGHLTKKYSTGELFPQSIQFVYNMTYNETAIVADDQDVSVIGTKSKSPAQAKVLRTIVKIVPSTTASSLFTIKGNAKLSVSGLDLCPIAKCGLFCVESSGDSLKLSDLGIVCSLGAEYSQPLIKSNGRPISIELCTFNTTTSGTARLAHPLVQLVPPSGGSVPSAAFTLSSVSFSDFETKSDPLVVADTDGTISVVGTTFTRCSCLSEIKGTLFRVKTSRLDTAITEALWSGSFDASTEAGWFFGQDRSLVSTDELFELSLLLFLGTVPSGTVFVSDSAHSSPHPNCGSSRVGCSSFGSGVASSSKFSISTISLSCRCEMSRLFEASSSFTIESPTSPSSLTLKEESQFKISPSSAVLLLSSLQMEIDSSCSSSPLFVASKGTLLLSSCEIGTDTKTLLPPSVTMLMEVLGEGTLHLTTSTIKNVEFTHASKGSAIVLRTSATFSTNSVNIFSGISSNGTGSHIFVNSDDLSGTAINATILPFNATLLPAADSLFSETDKNRFFGKEGSGEWSLLYLWHPHTSGSIHINTLGEDHPNCGTTHLPCSSIVESQSKLKGEQKLMNLDTKSVLSREFVSTTTEWTLTQSSGGSLWIEEEGQLTISKSKPSKLTLSGMTMKFGTLKEGRTSAVMLIEEGWMILSLCEIGDGLSEIGISVGRVCGGSLTIGGTKMNLVSSTAPLISTESGSLIVEESCTITHPDSPRTAPLLSISGGSASLTSTTIPPITLSSSNSVISVSGSGSLSVRDVDFDSMKNSGSGAVLHFSSSGCLSLDGVNLNGSRCGSSGKGRSLFISRPDAFTSNNLHLSDVTVTQPTSSGTHEIFIEGTSLESAACSDWKSFVGSDASKLTLSTIVENWFENKENSSLSVPIAYLIFGHSIGAVHINTDFWDHPNCGIEQLPCSSLLTAHNKLTEKDQNIVLHSDVELSEVINAKSRGSVISSSSSSSPTKLTLTGVAQFKVPASTSLTLTSLVVSLPAAITKPIFLVAAGSLSLTSVDIQNTAVTTRSAAHLFSVTSGSLVLTDTNMLFDHLFELESSSVIEQNGGHVEMTRCPLGNVSKVTGDGSVVHSALTSATDSLLIEGGSFSSCSSGGKGGVIFVSSAAAVPSSNLIVRSTFDSSCSCGSSEKGSWVFVEGHLLSSLIAETNWQTTITSLSTPTHDSLLWGTDLSEKLESDYGSVSLLAFLAEYNNNSISVGAGGQDVSGCGLTIRRCVGLDLAHSHLDGVGTHSLVIHSESSLSSSISISAHDLTLSAIGDSARVSVGLDGGFVISESELMVSKLDFVSNSKPQSGSLLEVNGGSGMISECSFTSFTLTSSALISHSCGTLTLLKTNFTSISRKVGNGGVLESVLTTSMELVVDDIWMKSVSALDGSGDGIFVSLTSIPKLSPIPSFRLQNVKYSVSSETNVSPRFIWVEGNDLSSWLDYSDSRFDGSYGVGVDEDWLWSVDKSESFSSSLVFYLKKGSGAIGFSEEGIVHARCGYFSAWCKSIAQTLVRAAEMETTQINVKEFGRITSLIDISNVILFKGSPLMSIVRMSGGGSFCVAGGDTIYFESLHFEIENEDRTEPAFCGTSGSLTLSSLSFVSSDAANVFSSQLIHSTAPLTLTNVNVSSVSLLGVALIESWSDVLVDGCRFSSISRSTGLGSVIEANISVSTVIKILHTTFENCRSESITNWILLKGMNTMTNEVSSWEGTLSRSSDRNGVMVADSDESTVYSLVDILFPRAISNVFVGSRGIDDLTSCGDESAPCRTISFGFEVGLTRKDSSETVTVSLIEQTGFGGCVCVGSESLLITAGIGRPRLVVEDYLEKDSDGSGIVNVEGGSVTLSDLTLLLPTFASPKTAVRPVSLIFGSGTALFSNIVVSQSSTQSLNLGLCWIVGGSLSMEQVRISQIEMSEDVCLIVAVSETKPLICSIVESEITRTSTKNSALLVFSSSSPLSHCDVIDCTFSHSTNTQHGAQSESAGSLVAISTKQADLSIEDSTFEECWMIPSSTTTSIIHVTVITHHSHSVSTVSVIRCKFLSSQSTSLPSSFIHFSLHSPHVSVLFEDSLFFESSKTNTKGGVLIEYWAGLPIVIRRRTVFKRCTVILSEIQPQISTHQNSLHDDL
ncbi:hypothetical protein BLNAU_22964 [Blattamonas nauphoetae]|uniref:Uncharacterized protein n=1 Tax=Blattamonas nauphoetae TaxID=2049346 RepID=A0ABQ9WRL1_9EUKA|nr:hypothetical protein BLNAU_22964 [Blattamonas nauphoetae]